MASNTKTTTRATSRRKSGGTSKTASAGTRSKRYSKAPAPTSAKAADRTTYEWLVKEETALVNALTGKTTGDDGAAITITKLATTLDREPLSVLRHIESPSVQAKLEKLSLNIDLITDPEVQAEIQAELFGLALAGVPLAQAWAWCGVFEREMFGGRLTYQQVQQACTSADLRAAFTLANDAQIAIPDASTAQLDALRALASQPLTDVLKARQQVLEAFEAPTPVLVAQCLFGMTPKVWAGYHWVKVQSISQQDIAAAKAAGTPITLDAKPSKKGGKKKAASAATSTSTSTTSSRKYSSGRRRTYRRRSPSYPSGSSTPVLDTRTAAEKAWENWTHW